MLAATMIGGWRGGARDPLIRPPVAEEAGPTVISKAPVSHRVLRRGPKNDIPGADPLQSGDREKVVGDTGDDRFPVGAIVRVLKFDPALLSGSNPDTVHVCLEGRGTIVESELPVTVLEKVGEAE